MLPYVIGCAIILPYWMKELRGKWGKLGAFGSWLIFTVVFSAVLHYVIG